MKNDQNIRYIHSPNGKDFPDEDVANLVEELIWSEIKDTSHQTRDAAASVLKDISRGPAENMCKFRDQGNAIIAKDGEKTVGMIGFQELHRTPNGQRIFEIRRTTVLTDYRGGGIGRVLRESMIKRLKEIDPDAILVSRIRVDNTVNQNLATSTQFTKISDDEVRKLGFSEDCIQSNKSNGYEFYIFNLRNNVDMSIDDQKQIESAAGLPLSVTEDGREARIASDTRQTLTGDINAVYSADDVRKWEQGATRYKKFLTSIPNEKRWCLRNVNEGELQAIFLGEKPAMFSGSMPTGAEHLGEELQHSGLRCAGSYIYSPEGVERVLREYPKEFEGLSSSSPEEFMQALARMPMGRFATGRGLILGYPMPSIVAYEKQNKFQLHAVAARLYDLLPDKSADKEFLLNEFFGNRKDKAGIVRFFTEKLRERQADLGIAEADIPLLLTELDYLLAAKHANVNGVIWVDFEESPESNLKQQRLQAAFQQSGIRS